MRDFIIAAIVFGGLPFILRSSVLGAYAWAWLSMMNPHRGAFGFARHLPFAQVVAIVTLLSLLSPKNRKPLPINTITVTLLLMLFWMAMTSFVAIAPAEVVQDRLVFVMKTQLMLLVTLMVVRGRQDIDRLIWVVVVSIGFYGVKGGFFTVATGGSGRVWGPTGSLLEGNNELAVALVMIVPLMAYLFQTVQRKWLRTLLVISMLFCGLSILGTQSRGALLALVAMGLFLGLKSKRPVLATVVIVASMLVVVAFMPDTWTKRMDTIQTYQADDSAMTRIYTWRTLFNCAVDRPFTGAGFGADNPAVFERYAPRSAEFAGYGDVVLVAHSIYFQMMGEHGFPGLGLFLLIGVFTWVKASSLARKCKDDPDFGAWVPVLMPMVQVGIIGYALGGAFLSLAYLDVPYYVIALVVMVDATVKDRDKAIAMRPKTATPTGTPGAMVTPAAAAAAVTGN